MLNNIRNRKLAYVMIGAGLMITSANSFADSTDGPASVLHVAGYGDISYSDVENDTSGFNSLHFNPLFLFQFTDKLLFEAELETEVEDNGETEVKLEFADINLFLNDNMTLVAGKFLSPIGYFRQNLHPSWINKLPSAPPGFGHDGAAPIAEIGVQLRGAHVTASKGRWHYAVYSGNGPSISQVAGEIHGVDSEGNTGNEDDSLTFGGRIGYQPLTNLEFGLSVAFGEVALIGEANRDYSVFGFDFMWQVGALDFRGEYIEQEVDALVGSVAPASAKWKTGYVQAAYRFLPSNIEVVLRYTDFESAHADESQEQVAIGVNHLMAANIIGKLAYHSNKNDTGSAADNDVVTLQLTYGF